MTYNYFTFSINAHDEMKISEVNDNRGRPQIVEGEGEEGREEK